jgi:hypothetical protein
MDSAVAPVLVNITLWTGGGHGILLEFSLQKKLRLAGMSCAVPFVNVIAALLNLVVSVMETALTLTAAFAGSVAGPLNVDVPGLLVLAGFIVPHPGEQSLPLCVRVQFNPGLLVGSLETLAVNWGVPLIGTIPLAGLTADTTIAGTVTDA